MWLLDSVNVTTNGISFPSIVFGWRSSQNLYKERQTYLHGYILFDVSEICLSFFGIWVNWTFGTLLLEYGHYIVCGLWAASLQKYRLHNQLEKPRTPTLVQPKMCSVRPDVGLLVDNVEIICRAAAPSKYNYNLISSSCGLKTSDM